jgi:hypothetical protein
MRDTFLLLWVGFLVIGVVGSIVSSMRKQIAAKEAARQPARRIPAQLQPPPGQLPQRIAQAAAPVRQVAAPVRKPVVTPPKQTAASWPEHHELSSPRAESRGRRVFGSRKAIVQAVIAAEVLGKPRALRDEYF